MINAYYFDFIKDKKDGINYFIKNKNNTIFSCDICPFSKNINSPKIEPFGNNKKGIMLIGEAPGKEEDKQGIPFVGDSGILLDECLYNIGIDMFEDCIRTNIFQCYPPNGKFPKSKKDSNRCMPRLMKQIKEYHPNLIIAIGGKAIERLLTPLSDMKITPMKFRGRVIPNQELGILVGCVLHPAWIIRNGWKEDDIKLLTRDLKNIIYGSNGTFKKILDEEKNNVLLNNFQQVCQMLDSLLTKFETITFDYETNSLNTFQDDFKIYMVSVAWGQDNIGYCIPFEEPFAKWTKEQKKIIYEKWKKFLVSDVEKCIQNEKYERHCSDKFFGIFPNNVVYDTMIATHILDSRKGTTSLKFQTYCLTGTRYKDEIDTANINKYPLSEAGKYNCLDVRYTNLLMRMNRPLFEIDSDISKRGETLDFFLEGNRTLANMEKRGIFIDDKELKKQINFVSNKISTLEKNLQNNAYVKEFENKHNKAIKLNSPKDIQNLLSNVCKQKLSVYNEDTDNYSVDVEVLKEIINNTSNKQVKDFLKQLLDYRKCLKYLNTYLENFDEKRDKNGFMHPSFMLHTVETFRSSSENPNFQNIPKRDEDQKEIRKCIIPRFDHLLDYDLKGAEVNILACYSKDKKLIEYLENKIDFHILWASRLYQINMDDVTPEQKDKAKQNWDFALFYGSWIENIIKSGVFKGIADTHLRRMEKLFWEEEFTGVKKWQEEIYNFYKRRGYVETFLGFRRYAPLSYNQVINTPIQGTSFHFLLQGLIKLDKFIEKNKIQTFPIIQVHDDIVIDAQDKYVELMDEKVKEYLTKKIYDWQVVPMRVDGSIGKNWLDMKSLI